MPTIQDEESEPMDGSGQEKTLPDVGQSRRQLYLQIFIGVIANLGSLSPGMSLGFSAIALPQLTSSSNSFQLNTDQASWFAGLAAVAMPVGCLLSGPLMDRFGRKMMLLLINVPCLIGWLLIGSVPQGATSLSGPGLGPGLGHGLGPGLGPGLGLAPGSAVLGQLYLGRIFTGLSTGMTSVSATIYLAEIASSSAMRSILVTWTSVSIAAGVLIVYVLGAMLQESWQLIANICAIFPLVSFVAVIVFLPESPVWLIAQGRPEPALKSLKALRGGKQCPAGGHLLSEFAQLTSSHARAFKPQTKQTLATNVAFLLSQPEAYKPLLIMNGYFLFQQASGTFVVIFYAVDVVEEAGVTIDGYQATVMIGLMRFVITLVVSFTSTKWGRRPSSILSGVGMTLAMAFLGTWLLLEGPAGGGTAGSWLAVGALLLYIAAATIGFLTLPWAMLGEVFPARVRATASGVTTCLAYTFSFVLIKCYPLMRSALGPAGVFLFYAAMCAAGTLFVACFLPETRAASVEDVARHFAATVSSSRSAPRKLAPAHTAPWAQVTGPGPGHGTGPGAGAGGAGLDLPLLEDTTTPRTCIVPSV